MKRNTPNKKKIVNVIMGTLGRNITKNKTERVERERKLSHPLYLVLYPDITNALPII